MKFNIQEPFLSLFKEIQDELGKENVFLVGGFVRDGLLNKKSSDLDIACSLNPEIIFSHYPDALHFFKYGTFSFKRNNIHTTIASMRKEDDYIDFRHPNKIEFVNSLFIDYERRDFTINALYVNDNRDIIDPSGLGVSDLENYTIRIIGDKKKRLTEDPLRIIRAYRFSYELGFSFEEETKEAINDSLSLLKKLNKNKIREEILKVDRCYRLNILTDLKMDELCDIMKKKEIG